MLDHPADLLSDVMTPEELEEAVCAFAKLIIWQQEFKYKDSSFSLEKKSYDGEHEATSSKNDCDNPL